MAKCIYEDNRRMRQHFMNVINKLFIMQRWDIGYCFETVDSIEKLKTTRFAIIKSSNKEWYADPFCINYNKHFYIFCEVFHQKSGKGNIGVFEYANGKFSKCNIIIDEPFHMSYPNVFMHNDRWYMIPETSAQREVRLYEAEDFPYKWKFSCTLLKGA